MHPLQRDQLRQDREQIARVVNFLRSEQGAMSAVIGLATGTATIFRDGKISFARTTTTGGPT